MAEQQKTVHEVSYDLLRSLGLTTVFGNPGSTEETFLKNFPDDSTYVLGLQEASVMAMADGFAQSTGKPALVNVHTAAALAMPWAVWWRPRGNTPSSSRRAGRPAKWSCVNHI
jgi:benzoylformate decarboxylase